MNRKTGPTHQANTGKKDILTTAKKTQSARKGAGKSSVKVRAELDSALITPEERSQMIAEAAYYRAEQRGFSPEGQARDWFEAEAEVDGMLGKLLRETKPELSH
jgi:hypothetical protein